jgi:hypothetical protein
MQLGDCGLICSAYNPYFPSSYRALQFERKGMRRLHVRKQSCGWSLHTVDFVDPRREVEPDRHTFVPTQCSQHSVHPIRNLGNDGEQVSASIRNQTGYPQEYHERRLEVEFLRPIIKAGRRPWTKCRGKSESGQESKND